MTREMEERIVAMYFDNKDFEKNAKTTIETLGQLKEGLNLEQSSKGLETFEKLGKTLNFEKAKQSLTKMKSTLSSMTNIFKKVFDLTPIHAAGSAVSKFVSNYLNKVIGFNVADKITSSIENTFRNLTIAPISAGWTQYEKKMDDVKTIMSSTGESMSVVESHLQNLTDYANQTIYSLSDMTSNLGKFTNNGMKLEDSVQAMKGIANAAADAGQGAQQASMAMYNFSQAMGVGKMTSIDWKSIENANMATTKLKNTFIEMAAAQGELRKEFDETDQKYHYYYTKNSKGVEQKNKKNWTEITASSFRESLSKGWLTSDAMMHALQIYAGEGIDINTLKSWGITDEEQIEELQKLGKEALEAATQVRTFSKMMDALKESVQSGWADSFQIIFGNMEQGTNLWTRLSETIDGVMTKATEARNAVLRIWAGEEADTSNEEQQLEEKKQSIEEILEEINKLEEEDAKNSGKKKTGSKKIAGKGSYEVEAGYTGKNAEKIKTLRKQLALYSDDIDALEKKIEEKKATPKSMFVDEEGNSGRDIVIKSLFDAIDLVKELGSKISEAWGEVFGSIDGEKLFNLSVGFRDAVRGISEWLTKTEEDGGISNLEKIKNIFKGIFNVVKVGFNILKVGFNLVRKIAKPIVTWLIDKFSKLSEFFGDIGNMNLGEIITKIGEGIKIAWEKIKAFFTPQEVYDEKGFKTTSTEIPAVTWLKNVWTKLKSTVKDWAYDNGLGTAWETLSNWWSKIEQALSDGKDAVVKVWDDVKKWFDESGIGKFFVDTWTWISSQFKAKKKYDDRGFELNETEDAPVVSWLKGIWKSIEDVWNQIKEWPVWNSIATFASNTWTWISSQFKAKKKYDDRGFELYDEDAPVVSWLKGIWKGIEDTWKSITEWPIWTTIATFATNTWTWISSQFKAKKKYDDRGFELYDEDAPVVSWLKGIWKSIEDVWNQIKEWPVWNSIATFASNTWTWISSQFKAKKKYDDRGFELNETEDAPVVSWLKGIWEGIKSAWDSIVGWEGWPPIGKFLSDTWSWITGLFSGSPESTAGASEETVEQVVEKAVDQVTLDPEKVKDKEKSTQDGLNILDRIFAAIGGFFEKIGALLGPTTGVPEIDAFLKAMGDFLKGVFTVLTKLLQVAGNIMNWQIGDTERWAIAIVIIGIIVTKVGELLNNRYLAKIGESEHFGDKILKLSASLLIVSAAIALLTTVDQKNLGNAALAVVAIGVVLAVIIGVLTKLKQTNTNDPVKWGERVLNNLISTLGKVGILAVALLLLPDIIKAIGEVEKDLDGKGDFGGDFLNVMLGIAALISAIAIVMTIVSKLTGGVGLDPRATLSTILSILEVILVVFIAFTATGGIINLIDKLIDAINGSDIDTVGGVISALNTVSEILQGIGGALGSFFRGLFGIKTDEQALGESANMLDTLSEMASKFDKEQIAGMMRMLTLINALSTDTNINTNKLTDFGVGMANLGYGIYTIAQYLAEVEGPLSELHDTDSDTYKKFQNVAEITKMLADAMSPFGNDFFRASKVTDTFDHLAGADTLSRLVNNMQAIMNGFAELKVPGNMQNINFDGISIVSSLYDAIQIGLNSTTFAPFDTTSLIDAILEGIGLGEMAIAQYVHDFVQNGIDLAGSNEDDGPGEFTSKNKETEDYITNLFGSGDTDMSDIMNALNKEFYGEDGNGGIAGLLNGLKDKVPSPIDVFSSWINFEDENGNKIDLLGEVETQISGLSAKLGEMDAIQVKITPVFDMSNMTPEALQAELDKKFTTFKQGYRNGNLESWYESTSLSVPATNVNSEATSADLGEIKGKLDAIYSQLIMIDATNSINGSSIIDLGAHMDGVADSVSGMVMVLDTGALVAHIVPKIDVALGARSRLFDRTGVIFK